MDTKHPALDYRAVVHELYSPLTSLKLVLDHTARTLRRRDLGRDELLAKLSAASRQVDRMSAKLAELREIASRLDGP